ncbi:isoleucyl-tRNA synthetase [Obba rivulosa]|uniref:isoleucine--tRNA ligase n=1 Tax=Obba rivulosa TaxID=1052685 RepID=A0A8E2DQL9_9APHY|nr:isoleucyl-tRNA synthetase [Obba rivulosa]
MLKRKNDYSDTMHFPQSAMPMHKIPGAKYREKTTDALYKWQAKERVDSVVRILHDGPPYANGNLHMGHALNKIIKDIWNRFQVLRGNRVHYVPGWDCHGLPIESKVLQLMQSPADERDLSPSVIRSKAQEYAKSQIEVQKKEFRTLGIMADWKNGTYTTADHDYQIRQLKVFQAMVDKDLIYRSHRPVHYSPSSHTALAESELEYKNDHVSHAVHVAFDLDLNSPNMTPSLRELLAGRETRLLVWTTTPWTLTANMGIAVNPEMDYAAYTPAGDSSTAIMIMAVEREAEFAKLNLQVECLGQFKGSDLVDSTYRPLFSSFLSQSDKAPNSLPIVPSSHVTPDSGTGLVHCAPAHGQEDYHLFQSLGMLGSSAAENMVCHVDTLGNFSDKVAEVVGGGAAGRLAAKDVLDLGSREIVAMLKESGALLKVGRHKHSYPYDWRTHKPVIMIATSQWFANLDMIKAAALEATETVSYTPLASKNRLQAFVRSRSEWCISRQRVWGVPIPSLHNIETGEALLTKTSLEHIIGVLDKHGVDYWWKGPVAAFVPPELCAGMSSAKIGRTWRKGTDTMDVWFDSGTSWTLLMDQWRDLSVRQLRFRRHGAHVCVEGSDQHRGWFQSLLLTAVATLPVETRGKQAPYGKLITHGMVLDENDRKMSKSLGNVISPMDIINAPTYGGADGLRLWVASNDFTKDVNVGPQVLTQTVHLLKKYRNSIRYMMGCLNDSRLAERDKVDRKDLRLIDRWMLHQLSIFEHIAFTGYRELAYQDIVSHLSRFLNVTLSSLYIDINKDTLYADKLDCFDRRCTLTVFEVLVDKLTTITAPILPHIAEEVNEYFLDPGEKRPCKPKPSVFTRIWDFQVVNATDRYWSDAEAEKKMSNLLRIRAKVLDRLEKARSDKRIKSSLEADVILILPSVESDVGELIKREAGFLRKLFIVSDVRFEITDEENNGWLYTNSCLIPGCPESIGICVVPTRHNKCPRCWTYSSLTKGEVCKRCEEVLLEQPPTKAKTVAKHQSQAGQPESGKILEDS